MANGIKEMKYHHAPAYKGQIRRCITKRNWLGGCTYWLEQADLHEDGFNLDWYPIPVLRDIPKEMYKAKK